MEGLCFVGGTILVGKNLSEKLAQNDGTILVGKNLSEKLALNDVIHIIVIDVLISPTPYFKHCTAQLHNQPLPLIIDFVNGPQGGAHLLPQFASDVAQP